MRHETQSTRSRESYQMRRENQSALVDEKRERRAKEHYPFRYNDRISTLTHYGNVYALSIILFGQFIFLNLHYILGATLTVIAVLNLGFEVIFSLVEKRYLRNEKFERLNTLLDWHFFINHLFILAFIPFLLWAVVLMYQRAIV